jgi:pimeloyl-ACP methyl ester carboxylesterase
MQRYLLLLIVPFLSAPLIGSLPYGPIRAAYEFSYGTAYSASATLPAYRIVDLGPGLEPISINDSLIVLAKTADKKLIRWAGGESIVLSGNFRSADWARMNEEGSVLLTFMTPDGEFEFRYWDADEKTHCVMDFADCLPYPPYYRRPYAFNDQSDLAILLEGESGFFAFAPYTLRIETNLVNAKTDISDEISAYEYHIDENYDLQQGGILYDLNDINNYGESVGEVYSDSAYTVGYDTIYNYQEQFFALNRDTVLDFEPFLINDLGTVLGRTLGPQYGIVIYDEFGQRYIGPALPELESVRPCMSNPLDGLEEIVIENHYWKQMTERDFAGRPTGQPSPDFWEGKLDDLIQNMGRWNKLKASCISANGRIAGTGRYLNPATLQWETRAFLLMPQLLHPDWDRDGVIDSVDKNQSNQPFPWYFWVNDDDDLGDLARSSADDLPASDEPDWESPGVDGMRDIVDFFPLQIDIRDLLRGVENLSDIEVTLSQQDSALNFVYTNLSPDEVGQIHTTRHATGFGPLFSQPLESAPTHPISASPVALSQEFLRQLRDDNHGILLIESNKPTSEPLVMNYRYKGSSVFTCELPISLAPVRDMMRIVNLRNVDPKFSRADPGPWATDMEEPPNLPDAFLRSFENLLPTLVHIHGYNWGGDQIPAAHSEIFKRFFQMGSCARYVGVTWFGDQGTLELLDTSFDYNENVINAFVTAGYVKSILAGFGHPLVSVFAHSLGNMVASSAIVDHGWDVLNYFMINAAVPTEAYLGEQEDRRKMVHPDWKDEGSAGTDYSEHLLPSNWSALFQPEDRRSLLTWKERFASISQETICYNFYSTGEDILRSGNGDLPGFIKDVWKTELIWVFNEMVKGTSTLAASIAGEVHAGWGFNHEYMTWINPGGAAHPPDGEWVRMSTSESAALPAEALVADPFFKPFSDGDSDFPNWSDGSWLYESEEVANAHLPPSGFNNVPMDNIKNHAKVLAEGLPAHSSPAGSSILPKLPLLKNYDLDTAIRKTLFWPVRSPAEKQNRWLHSDYLNPALPFVAELYQICVESINK